MLEFYGSRIPGARIHLQRRALMVGTGWVQFKTSEEPDSLRGESIDFVVVDEAAHVANLQTIWELCLRPCLLDRRGGAWFISTPHGYNYFNTLYAKGRDSDDWASFQYSATANPHLDRKELEDITKDMPLLVKRQEIDAEFVQLAGAMFKRENIRVIESEPEGVRWVRSWDLAWTEKTTSDYTAGAKVGLTKDGVVVVSNVVCSRMEWPEAVRCVAATALVDGTGVRQGVECVGAQEGAIQTLMRDPLLAAHSIEPIRVHRDKLTRALPLVARSEQGKFALVRGNWNQQCLDHLCSFPEGEHDDIVDAISGALTMMETPTSFSTADGWGVGTLEPARQQWDTALGRF